MEFSLFLLIVLGAVCIYSFKDEYEGVFLLLN